MESELLMSSMLLYRPCRLIPNRKREDLRVLWHSSVNLRPHIPRAGPVQRYILRSDWFREGPLTGLAMLYSYWKLNPGTLQAIRALDSCNGRSFYPADPISRDGKRGKCSVQGLRTPPLRLSKLREGDQATSHDGNGIPEEVRCFHNYSSLTSIWAADQVLLNYRKLQPP